MMNSLDLACPPERDLAHQAVCKLLSAVGGRLAAAVNRYIEAQVRYHERLFGDLTDGREGTEGMNIEFYLPWDGLFM
jgi:hypothetical protein